MAEYPWYRMTPDDDDDFGDSNADDGGYDDGNQPDDDQPDDDDDSQPDDDQPGDDDGDDSGGDDDPQSLDDEFDSSDDLPQLDPDSALDASSFPDADASDFEDDRGDWTSDDYQESAQSLFGRQEFFGDTLVQQRIDEGFTPFENPAFGAGFDRIAPGTSQNLQLFERNGTLVAFGFVAASVLAALRAQYKGIDLSNVELAVPPKGQPSDPQPLPPAFANMQEKDAVDLRKFCSPVGDQGQTSRCSAFAWTHGVEMARNLQYDESNHLSCNFTMLQFQRQQGDARDYRYAYSGGDGTVSGPEPGGLLAERGTCQHDFWPDDEPAPRGREEQLTADAGRFRLDGVPLPIALEDVRKVLSAGCPVHLSMNTGTQFARVGRDGLFNAAETPSGQHGRHAMLMVGYIGNFYIVKNSWGSDWGDQGYSYIPKNVLAASDPELIAILLKQPPAPPVKR